MRWSDSSMTDINVRAHPCMIAFIDESDHRIYAVQEAQPKRLEFERDINFLPARVIANATAGFQSPIPLCFRRNNLALPHVFAKHKQHILCVPGPRKVYEFLRALDMKLPNWRSEISKPKRTHRQRNNRQPKLLASLRLGLLISLRQL